MSGTIRTAEAGPVLASVLADAEFELVNTGSTTVATFEAAPNTIYVLRASVFADNGANPTFRTYLVAVGNGIGGGFVIVTTQGAINILATAAAGGPGPIPVNFTVAGPESPIRARVRVTMEPFAYVDV